MAGSGLRLAEGGDGRRGWMNGDALLRACGSQGSLGMHQGGRWKEKQESEKAICALTACRQTPTFGHADYRKDPSRQHHQPTIVPIPLPLIVERHGPSHNSRNLQVRNRSPLWTLVPRLHSMYTRDIHATVSINGRLTSMETFNAF